VLKRGSLFEVGMLFHVRYQNLRVRVEVKPRMLAVCGWEISGSDVIADEGSLKGCRAPLTPAQWLPKPASRWFPENSLSLRDQRSPSDGEREMFSGAMYPGWRSRNHLPGANFRHPVGVNQMDVVGGGGCFGKNIIKMKAE